MTAPKNHWVNTVAKLSIQPCEKMIDWLTKPTILSQALRRVCQNLTVNLISQEFANAIEDEYQILNIDKNECPLVRKVFLEGSGQPLTYGRVIIAPLTYRRHFSQFDALHTSPIGESMLYHNPEVTRDPFEYTSVDENGLLFQEIQQKLPSGSIQAPLFGRRSVFWMKQDPLLVTEFFLPTLPSYLP